MKYYKLYFYVIALLPSLAFAKIYKCSGDGRLIYRDTECGSDFEPLAVDNYIVRQNESYSKEGSTVKGDTKQAAGKTELNIKADKDNHYRIAGSIDKEPVTFLVDTGATAVVIPIEIAEKAGLEKKSEVDINTANGTAKGYETEIKELVLDGILLKDIFAVMAPNMPDDELLLGMSALLKFKMIQDGDTMQLILK